MSQVKNKAIDLRNRKYSVEEFSEKFGTNPPQQGKHSRRLAIKCAMVEKSKSNPGYYKYMITISEKDGTIHKEPAYGRDMQSALSRLIRKERTFKIEKKFNTATIFLMWGVIMGWPLLILRGEMSPQHLLFSFATIGIIGVGIIWNYNYIHRGE